MEKSRWIGAGLLLLLVGAVVAKAAVPNRIVYQGRLSKSGVAVAGKHTFVARILSANSGEPLWSSGSLTVELPATGEFSLVLEPSGIDWLNDDPRLEITVDGEKLSPADQFSANPYALVAEQVADGAIGTPQLADGAVTNAKIASSAAIDPSKIKISDSVTLANWISSSDANKIDATVIKGSVPVDKSQIPGTAIVAYSSFTQLIEPTENATVLTLKPKTGSNPATTHILDLKDESDATQVRVTGQGRLGIGTSSPSEKLHVVGNIQASGQVQATDVNTTTLTTSSATVTNLASLFAYKVGTFTSSSSTGNQSVTGVGFKPRLILLFMGNGDSSGFEFAVGACTEDNDFSGLTGRANDSSQTGGGSIASGSCIKYVNVNGDTAMEGSLSSTGSDGFVINWTSALARPIAYIAFQ